MSANLNVLVFGHSYVRNLERLGHWDREIQGRNCRFQFVTYPGKDYAFLLEHSYLIDNIN